MRWNDVHSGGRLYSLAHLDPFVVSVQVGHRVIDVDVSFGFHVFTDEKPIGAKIVYREEVRFFCAQRWNDSVQAVAFLKSNLAAAYARPYFHRHAGQMYFVFDMSPYAMFMTIQKPADTVNQLKLRVVSGYTVQLWGQHSLPTRSKLRKMGYILDRRERDETIPLN